MVKVSVDEAVELLYAWALAVRDFDAARETAEPGRDIHDLLTKTYGAVSRAGLLECGVRQKRPDGQTINDSPAVLDKDVLRARVLMLLCEVQEAEV